MSDSNDRRDDSPEAAASLHRIWLLAHDLKNSFSLMSYAFHELPRHLSGNDPAKQAFTDLRSLLTHVELLTTTLLDTLRHREAGRTALSINDFLLEREVRLQKVCPGITVTFRLSASGGVVLAGAEELERLVFALISNACMAMPEGGDVTVSTTWIEHAAGAEQRTTWPRRYVRLTVADTSEGLDRHLHMRLLEPLAGDIRAVDAERDSVVSAVRRLHGWLIVESEESGGTRVHVCLPAVPEPPTVDLGRPLG